jgi:4-amino-4-deoxy-L-arabinose transferase-like glycosyltransferase
MIHPKTICRITLLLGLILTAVVWMYAPLNQDEGWYLIATQRISQGFLPYRDFAFTQAPVFPFAYQLSRPFVNAWGILGGRGFTALLGWSSILITAWTVYRVRRNSDPFYAVSLVLVLLALNTFHAQYLVTIKTYALASLWLASGLGCVFLAIRRKQPGALIAAGIFLGLAAGTRLTLILFIPALLAELFLRRKSWGNQAWIALLVSSVLTLLAIFLPFVLLAPEGLHFGLIEFHNARETGNRLLLSAAFASRFLLAYLPVVLASIPLLLRKNRWQPGVPGVLAGIILVTFAHALTPFPYDDYQVVLIPAIALVLALQLPEIIVSPELRLQSSTGLFAFALLYAAVAPQWQTWLDDGRDRIWWTVNTRPAIRTLQEAADTLHTLAPESDLLFTTDPYLAIEAGLDVPRGLEMGPFSFFPNMETDRAKRLHVLNPSLLQDLIASRPAPVAAFSEYGFTIQNPEIIPTPPDVLQNVYDTLNQHYHQTAQFSPFGQAGTLLRIYGLNQP